MDLQVYGLLHVVNLHLISQKHQPLYVIFLQVDGDTSTNDTVIALASGLSGSTRISSLNDHEAMHLQACLDVVGSIEIRTSL